jgi:hypothetical protein
MLLLFSYRRQVRQLPVRSSPDRLVRRLRGQLRCVLRHMVRQPRALASACTYRCILLLLGPDSGQVRILRLVRSTDRLVRSVCSKLWRLPRLVVRWIADHRKFRHNYANNNSVSCDHDSDHRYIGNDSSEFYHCCCGPTHVDRDRCNQHTGDGRQRNQLLLLGSNCRYMRDLPVGRAGK